MVQNYPYGNLGTLYASGVSGGVDYVSTTQIQIQGQWRDSTNVIDIGTGIQAYNGAPSANPILITPIVGATTVNGAGGLDAGTFSAGTGYYVHAIASSSGNFITSGLISLSATAPTLPFGYDAFRMIGWVRTLGTAIFAPFDTSGNGNDVYFQYRTPIIMAAGTAITSTNVPLSDNTGTVLSVPAVGLKRANLMTVYTPTTAGNILAISGYNGSSVTAANGQVIQTGYVTAQAQQVNYLVYCGIFSGAPSISYIIGTAGTQTTHINGYEMNL